MARPKKHHIDSDKILQVIHRETFGRQAQIDEAFRRLRDRPGDTFQMEQDLRLEQRSAVWCPYRTNLLAGRLLTDAEARAWRRKITDLESAKLIEVAGVRGGRLRLSRKGRRRVKEILAERS